MKFFDYLKNHPVVANLLYVVVFVLIVTWVFSIILNFYTKHNKYIDVPDFTGVSITELDDFIKDKNITYIISDSIYDLKKQKGTICNQDPLPNTKVKSDRKIYLTIVAKVPEKVSMPDLVDLTLRQALSTLEAKGLKQGRIDYVRDMAENAVLKQRYNGKEIKPETIIESGSKINLVVGSGLSNKSIPVPDVVGMTRSKAIASINEASLNIGSEIFNDETKPENAVVTKQKPTSDNKVKIGTSINLWYGKIKDKED